MKFSRYDKALANLHLYISKQTPERQDVRKRVLSHLIEVDGLIRYHDDYSEENCQEKIGLLLQKINSLIDLNDLPIVYTVSDYLLITPLVLSLNLEKLSRNIVTSIVSYLPNFPVLHELAVLCWYDKLISVNAFLDSFRKYSLSEKESYHILGELSHRYPRETLEFVFSIDILGEKYLERLHRKMITNRKKNSLKDFKLVGEPEDIDALWFEFGKKV